LLAAPEVDFRKGRFVGTNGDIGELKAKKDSSIRVGFLRISSLDGLEIHYEADYRLTFGSLT